jgi:hypothetical protein
MIIPPYRMNPSIVLAREIAIEIGKHFGPVGTTLSNIIAQAAKTAHRIAVDDHMSYHLRLHKQFEEQRAAKKKDMEKRRGRISPRPPTVDQRLDFRVSFDPDIKETHIVYSPAYDVLQIVNRRTNGTKETYLATAKDCAAKENSRCTVVPGTNINMRNVFDTSSSSAQPQSVSDFLRGVEQLRKAVGGK